MIKHFVLNLNPTAQFEWERCALQHPITAEQPNFADLIAASVTESIHGDERWPMNDRKPSGSYLVSVKLEVTILESNIPESISESISETISDSSHSSMTIPFVETERVNIRSKRPTLQGLKVS